MKLPVLFLITVPLLAQQASTGSDAASADPIVSGSIETGYRFLPNISGNQFVYFSTVFHDHGVRLVSLDLTFHQPSHKYSNRLNVQIDNWGEPYNTERLDVQKNSVYRFTLDNNDTAYFNFLPSFANPFLDSGTQFTYSSFDTWIRNTDAQLDLFPGTHISPFVGWSRSTWNGRGAASFFTDENQYAVPTTIADHTDTYRGGVQIQGRKFHVTLEAGETEFKDDQGLASLGVTNAGDLFTPFMGQLLTLDSLTALYRVRGDSTFMRASFAATPASWASVSGQFLYSDPSTKSSYTATSSGDLFSLDAFSFYNLGQDMATANAQMPRTTGAFSVELRPLKRLRLVESWSTDRMHNASDLLLIEQLSFAGSIIGNTTSPDADRLNLNQNQQEFDAYYDITPWLTIRGGEKYTWGEALLRGAAVLDTPFESASLSQQAGLGGIALRVKDRLRVNGDFEGGSANQSFFRTSLHDYEKFRGRAEFKLFDGLKLSGDFLLLRNHNPDPSVQLNFLSHAESAALSWTPAKSEAFDIVLDYTRSHLNSDVYFLVPQTLTSSYSQYLEDSSEATAFIQLTPWEVIGHRPRLSFGGAFFSSTGSRPTKFYQPTARVTVPLFKHLEGSFQWSWYGFSDVLYPFEGFRSNETMITFRYFL
jgi:hypothetical protein